VLIQALLDAPLFAAPPPGEPPPPTVASPVEAAAVEPAPRFAAPAWPVAEPQAAAPAESEWAKPKPFVPESVAAEPVIAPAAPEAASAAPAEPLSLAAAIAALVTPFSGPTSPVFRPEPPVPETMPAAQDPVTEAPPIHDEPIAASWVEPSPQPPFLVEPEAVAEPSPEPVAADDSQSRPRVRVVSAAEIDILPPQAEATSAKAEPLPFRSQFWDEEDGMNETGFAGPRQSAPPLQDVREIHAARAAVEQGDWFEALERDLFGSYQEESEVRAARPAPTPQPIESPTPTEEPLPPPQPIEQPQPAEEPLPTPQRIDTPSPTEIPTPPPVQPGQTADRNGDETLAVGQDEPRIY